MATPKDLKWTNSSLSTLQDCGVRYQYQYLDRIFVESTPPQIRGTSVHQAVRVQMRQKLATKELPTVEEVRAAAADAFDLEIAKGVRMTAEDAAQGDVKTVLGKQKDAAVALSALYRTRVAPDVTPIAFERRITVKPKDMDITVEGTIDLLDAVGGGAELVRDTKSREAAPQADMAETSQQFTMYGMLRLAETGVLPHDYQLDVLWRTPKTGKEDYRPLRTTRDMTDVTSMVQRINRAVLAVEKGIFIPANPTWWGCSERYCPYFDRCPFGAKGRSERPAA